MKIPTMTKHGTQCYLLRCFICEIVGKSELERDDPTLQLLGMRHDGKYLEEGSESWAAGVPVRGRFRTK